MTLRETIARLIERVVCIPLVGEGCYEPWLALGAADSLLALLAPLERWRDIESAPADEALLVWGGGGLRFMRRDGDTGQWRNMMHAPRPAPRFWMPLPPPPTTSGEG